MTGAERAMRLRWAERAAARAVAEREAAGLTAIPEPNAEVMKTFDAEVLDRVNEDFS